ncbi:MAG: hypothetical protein JJ974_10685 [Phycisphaerales bacterium]|nr:hypothetical protein [Phycisphaerales bacterium]
MMTLWDLLSPKRKARPSGRNKPRSERVDPEVIDARPSTAKSSATPMQVRYEEITRQMLKEHGVRVRKWRSSMSGVAWQVTYQDGTMSKLIESPKPKGPMSAAVFLHEIGHHAIGFGTYKPRCLEEYYAWKFSIEKMEELGLNVTDRVRMRMHESLEYAVTKALRRGLKRIPEELLPYLPAGIRVAESA